MAIAPSTDLIDKQRTADEAHAHLLEVQKRLGTRTRTGSDETIPPGERTQEQHADWDAAWLAWREAAMIIRSAVPSAEVEMAVKKAVRHPELSVEAA
ncbi:hypothetical protein [Streptomyces sp. NPDC058268]|uniref:hypothetical protein n=1 Tax=Streptomyces sp. NPDC058268 TaxID=3346413 RepID=UPI0036E79F54